MSSLPPHATARALLLALSLAATPAVSLSAPPPAAPPPAPFDLQAHRGGRDARPENTLAAVAYALELGVSTVELDLQLSRDGFVIVGHNPFLDPTLVRDAGGNRVPAGRYDIRALSLAELRQFDVGIMDPAGGSYFDLHGRTQVAVPGARMPTLEEVFLLALDYAADSVRFNLETKSYADPADPAHALNPDPDAFARAVIAIVRRFGMERRVTLQSFDWRTLHAARRIDPSITRVALSAEQPSWGPSGRYLRIGEPGPSPWLGGLDIDDFQGNFVRAAHAAGAHVTSPYWRELTPALVAEAHALGLTVIPWTVNDSAAMEHLLSMGVDGIITDRPWILREVLAARGLPLPAGIHRPDNPHHTGTSLLGDAPQSPSGGADAAH